MVSLKEQSGFSEMTFEIIEVDSISGYSPSVCADIKFKNESVSAHIHSIWFDLDDIKAFSELHERGIILDSKLEAVSEFSLTVKKLDELGHFKVHIFLENFVNETKIWSAFETNIPDMANFSKSLYVECFHKDNAKIK